MTPAPTLEVLDLVARTDAALRERVDLLERRRQMITEYHRTGERADPIEFSTVCDALRTNELLTLNLRTALLALGTSTPGGPQ